MKILLVGEYSGLHNNLKAGLLKLGHDVTLIATGDYFKGYPSDIGLVRKYDSGFGKKIKILLFKLFGIDITSNSLRKQLKKHFSELRDFDVVNLINESPLGATPKVEKELISYLKKQNAKLFLLSCGTDHLSVKYALSDALPHSILTPYKQDISLEKEFAPALKYTTPAFEELHEFVFQKIEGVIASDIDYHLPLAGHPKYLGLIPNPLNLADIPTSDQDDGETINIFLGINRSNYRTKGISFFENALELIKEKYPNEVAIQVVENLPYDQYRKKLSAAHIVLDQAYAQDQGYNALEAMAMGKVVFTGAGKHFRKQYQLEEKVAIHTIPDTDKIFTDLSMLIDDRKQITKIGSAASEFVRMHHDCCAVAEKYLTAWKLE